MKKILSLFLVPVIISSCSIYNNITAPDEGFAYFKINFSDKSSFNIKAIPETTNSIKITIKGEGLSDPIEINLNKNENNTIVRKLPEGKKNIEVIALNSKKLVVAEGKSELIIEKSKLNTVEIELKPTILANGNFIEKLNIDLKNINNDYNSIIQIKNNDFELIKEFKGNKVVLDNIPIGNSDIKISSWKDGFPSFNYIDKINIDKENLEIIPKIINIQKLYRFPSDEGMPQELINLLNNILVNTKDNVSPNIENISIEVNGNKKIFNFSSICVNPNDKISIKLKVNDKDNDDLFYFWGINEAEGNNFYNLSIQNNITNTFEKTIDSKMGNFSIPFVISDRKSFINSSISFNVKSEACN